MTRTAYFDCFSGVAGDMILGALVDSGLPVEELSSSLAELGLGGFRLQASKVRRSGISATKVDVVVEAPSSPVDSPDRMADLISRSGLPPSVKRDSIAIIRKIGNAESAVHGVEAGHVMFHEIGSVDTIVDVVGSVLGLTLLGVDEVLSSPVSIGTGFVDTQHGIMPVPPPASVEILRGLPTKTVAVDGEIATPTGCAILAVMAKNFGLRPPMVVHEVGYGAGDRKFEGRPNLLRVFLGHREPEEAAGDAVLLETNLDDLSGELLGHALSRLIAAGALDAWATPTVTKKNRPAHVLSVLVTPEEADRFAAMLFKETGTFGIRKRNVERTVLTRSFEKVRTRWGEVRIKIGHLPGGGTVRSPEFEDCLAVAKASGVSVREVLAHAQSRLSCDDESGGAP